MAANLYERKTVIVGGGIIGCSTAYYISRHPLYDSSKHQVILLEASSIAGGASGKAGGLLALWAYPSDIVPLSFQLHAELAAEHNGSELWDYRQLHAGQLAAQVQKKPAVKSNSNLTSHEASLEKLSNRARKKLQRVDFPSDLDWLITDNIVEYQQFGDLSNTAQVHPRKFTTCIAELAKERGIQILTGARVTKINSSDGKVDGVIYEDPKSLRKTTISASDVVLTAGAWTARIRPNVPIDGMRAHSVTIKPTRPLSAYALFTEINMPHEKTVQVTPEIYSRPNNEVYACGSGDHLVPLPMTTADVLVDDSYCQDIIEQVGAISNELRAGEVTAKQACYLPNMTGTASGPLIGPGDLHGLYIGAGHTCWGIQNGPGTGKLLSEFVFEGKAVSANITALDPRNVL